MKTKLLSRIVVLSAFLTYLISGQIPVRATELLSNGSFVDTSAWTVVPPQVGWTCIANGEAFLHPYPSGYVGVVIKQNLSADVSASKTVKFSAVMSKLGGPPGNTIAFKLTWRDESAASHDVEILSPSNDSISTATPLSKTITLPADAVRISGFSVNKTTNGMFTLQSVSLDLATPPIKPEIVVFQPAGNSLTDGKASRTFGMVMVGQTGFAKTFTIRNTGSAKLTGLSITRTGAYPENFIISALTTGSLAPATSTSFTVRFKPSTTGTCTAAIHIKSNDADENPFDIRLSGTGISP